MKKVILPALGIQWLIYTLTVLLPGKDISKVLQQKNDSLPITFAPTGCGDACRNPGFEEPGEEPVGWTGSYGKDDAFASCTQPDPCNMTQGWDQRPASQQTFDQHVIMSSGIYDPYLGGTVMPVVKPGNGRRSFRLGDLTANDVGGVGGRGFPAEASRASITYTVTDATANFTYQYAIILEEPADDHSDVQRPYFQVRVRDAAGNILPCGNYKVIAKKPFDNFQTKVIDGGGAVDNHDMYLHYRNWTSVLIPLKDYVGQCVTIEFTTSDCSKGGHLGYAYIDTDCAKPLEIESETVPCTGKATLKAPTGGVKYQWSNANGGTTGIVGPTNGLSINVNQSGTYKVIVTTVTGDNCTFTLTKNVVLDGLPATLERVPDIVVCQGSTIGPITFKSNPTNAAVQWQNTNATIGLAATGTGNINSFVAQNNTNQIQTALIKVKVGNSSCPGDSNTFTVQVLPQTKTTSTRNKTTVCAGEPVQAVTFSNNQAVTWQNTNTNIGLGANGTGDMNAFTSVNSTTEPIDALVTFKLTQSANCEEQTITYPIQVKPIPALQPAQDLETCTGGQLAVVFQATPPESEIKWTNSNPSIGLPAINGKGNIPTFKTTNYGTETSISSTISAFSDLNGCSSDTTELTLTVHPLPNVDLGPDLTATQDTSITLKSVFETKDIISYNWMPDTYLSCSDCPDPLLTIKRTDDPFAPFIDSMVYNLRVATVHGCSRTDNIAILIRYIPCAKGNIFIPTVFTPNGDGINDLFYIQGTNFGKVKQFLIFDRWGNKMFEKYNFIINDKAAGWDGIYKNQLVKTPATFVYYLTVECVEGQPQIIKGTITVLK